MGGRRVGRSGVAEDGPGGCCRVRLPMPSAVTVTCPSALTPPLQGTTQALEAIKPSQPGPTEHLGKQQAEDGKGIMTATVDVLQHNGDGSVVVRRWLQVLQLCSG